MPGRIEDYALIGDCQTAALVCRDGSIDWLCLPRFDSGACFAALLGTPKHGRWLIGPANQPRRMSRRYKQQTLLLETEFETDDGVVALVDCMPPREEFPILIRMVEGKRGQVRMRMDLIIRFDYGSVVPWVRRADGGLQAIAGPNALRLFTDAPLEGRDLTTVAEFTVSPGQKVPFVLAWYPSHKPPPAPVDAAEVLENTYGWWCDWSGGCASRTEWQEAVTRSLITLKALSYAPTGGIVAAATTSLPEQAGGVRNWDYRFCWVRDATFTLMALMEAGYKAEAMAWREWLLRAVAGSPSELQIMYGIAGERRLTEMELPWLPGYQGARPVRIGNAASEQFQLDVYGELIDAMCQSRRVGLEPDEAAWKVENALLEFLETAWKKPDEGIWEVRGPRRHFTHSKVMAWVAMDRGVKTVEKFGTPGPVERWKAIRDTIHREVCEQGFNTKLNSFVQYYGSDELDASLLMIPLVGFLPATDARMRGTVEAIQRNVMRKGFVERYATRSSVDGLPPGEGVFLACTFWLADNLYLMGRHDEARDIFERLLSLRNDVGLLSEEYDPEGGRLLGNFPQAFSHVGLINTAHNLSPAPGPADKRPAHNDHALQG
jgi:GH15 family glucan-1,4-alpha-glucosidase